MKAVVYEEYTHDNNFEKILKVKDIDEPIPESNEVIIQIKNAALNYNDIWGMRGNPVPVPLPHISGSEATGKVISIGEGVKNIKVGDRVATHCNISCRFCIECVEGREYNCPNRYVWGYQTGPLWGGFSEFTHLPETNVVKIPNNVTYEDASASMTLPTAWHMLVGRAKIQPGQMILIMGGSSGVGNYGIQIAKLFGCTVIATASPEKLDRVLELGADYAVNHRDKNWHISVRKITNQISRDKGRNVGIDIAFDHIGQTHFNKQLSLLKYGSTLVTTGATTGYDANIDLRHIFFKGTSILGSTLSTRADLEKCLNLLSDGKLKTVIDSTYSYEQAAQAHTRMFEGKDLFGKILLKPENEK